MTATTKDGNLTHSQSAPQNLDQLLSRRVAASPEKTFLISESDGRRFTYREFEQAVGRVIDDVETCPTSRDEDSAADSANGADQVTAGTRSGFLTRRLALLLQRGEPVHAVPVLLHRSDAVRGLLLPMEAGQRRLGLAVHHAVDPAVVEALRLQHALGLHHLFAGRRTVPNGG